MSPAADPPTSAPSTPLSTLAPRLFLSPLQDSRLLSRQRPPNPQSFPLSPTPPSPCHPLPLVTLPTPSPCHPHSFRLVTLPTSPCHPTPFPMSPPPPSPCHPTPFPLSSPTPFHLPPPLSQSINKEPVDKYLGIPSICYAGGNISSTQYNLSRRFVQKRT